MRPIMCATPVIPHSAIYGLLRADERDPAIYVFDTVCCIALGREAPRRIRRTSDEAFAVLARKLFFLFVRGGGRHGWMQR